VNAALPIPVIQLLQVLTVALGAPGVTGVIAKVEARLQGRRGPRVLQPYYDLAKLFRKEALAPEQASWFFLAAPLIAVTCYLTIPLLIPVLTSYGLPLGYMGDILGGGFLLSHRPDRGHRRGDGSGLGPCPAPDGLIRVTSDNDRHPELRAVRHVVHAPPRARPVLFSALPSRMEPPPGQRTSGRDRRAGLVHHRDDGDHRAATAGRRLGPG